MTDLGDGLQPRFVNAGVKLARGIQPAINYTYFNMEDPVVGGYTQERIALRRAFGMSYNCEEEIRVLWQNQGECATQPVPPGVTGYDPDFKGHVKYDVAGAKALLDKFGYVDRMATAGATFPTASRWSSRWVRRRTPAAASTRRCGSAASMPSA